MLHWTDFPDVPAIGTPVCATRDVQAGVTSLVLDDFSILLVKDAAGTRAFVNACPHQFLPLDTRGDVLGKGGHRLICSNHDAAFDAQTGQGVAGFGLNCALSPIPLAIVGAQWVIASE